MGEAVFSYRSLPHWGRGTAPAVLGYFRKLLALDDLPRSFSSRFPHPTSAPSGHLLPMEGGSVHASPFPWKGLPSAARRGWFPFLRRSRLLLAFPIGEGGPRQRRSGTFVNGALEMIFPALFHTASALSAPSGHLPLEGKALSVVMFFPYMRVFALMLWGKRYSRIAAFPARERLCPSLCFFHICVYSL